MSRHVLGKTPPKPKTERIKTPQRSKFSLSILGLFLLPLVAAGILTAMNPTSSQSTELQLGQSIERNSAIIAETTRTLGNTPPNQPANQPSCSATELTQSPLFPFIPEKYSLQGDCPPSKWNSGIIGGFLFKSLGILNYAAGAGVILAILYGGVIYLISGTTGNPEKTNERAKKIITAAITGFIIVLLARVIVQGSFYLFGDTDKFDDGFNTVAQSPAPSPSPSPTP